jgi:subtilisin family serine protease
MRFSGKLLAGAAMGAVFVSSFSPVAVAKLPNDPFFDRQWYLQLINAGTAWDTTVGDGSVIVAVLDTGVDLDHPDLRQNLWKNTKEIPGNTIDDDANGYVDDVDGWDFVDHDNNPIPTGTVFDENSSEIAVSHGTLISGIIGAETNNAIGYAGINWHVRIMPLRILNEEGGGGEEEATEAIRYAVKNGAKVINLSFVGDTSGAALRQAVGDAYHAGVTVVAALGNDGKDVDTSPVYPACFRSETEDWVIGVSATDENDAETEFTNFGKTCADLSAPGTNIQGLTVSDGDASLIGPQLAWDGTSAASPMVAGAAALIRSAFPQLTVDQVRSVIKLSVDPVKTTVSGAGALGVGRLNIAKALIVAQAMAGTAPTASVPSVPIPPPPQGVGGDANLSFIALGAAPGEPPTIRVYKADGTPYATFLAYASTFLGGVRVSMSDVNGDGTPEVIAAAGKGGGPQVRIFTASGTPIKSFFAFSSTSRQGVSVALGDVDGDFSDDIVAVVGAGVSTDAVVFGQDGVEKFRFPVSGFAAGTPLTVTVADVDDDYDKEVVIGPLSGAPRVAVYDNDGKPLVDFMAYGETMTYGISLASGDFDGDDRDEIVTAPHAPGSKNIRMFNKIGAVWGQFWVGDQSSKTGAAVAVTDIDVNGKPDVVVAPEHGAGDVQIFTSKGNIMGTLGTKLIGPLGTSLGAW